MMKNQSRVIVIGVTLLVMGLACSTLTIETEKSPQVMTDAPDVPTQPVPTFELIDPYWLSLDVIPPDGGILDTEHCDPICVMGFRPYRSTLTDYKLFVEAYSELDCSKLTFPYTFARCYSDTWQMDLHFDHYTEKVIAVSIEFNGFLLDEFIQVYGEPDSIYFPISEMWSTAWPNELYFSNKRAILWLKDAYDYSELSKEAGYHIMPESEVHSIYIYDDRDFPGDLSDFLPWQGYGIYFSYGKATEEI